MQGEVEGDAVSGDGVEDGQHATGKSLRIETTNSKQNLDLISQPVSDPHQSGNRVLWISAPELGGKARLHQGPLDPRALDNTRGDYKVGIETGAPRAMQRCRERTDDRVFDRFRVQDIDNVEKGLADSPGPRTLIGDPPEPSP